MAECPEIEMEAVKMAEIPPMTIRFTEAGVMQVAAIIAALKHTNDELQRSLTCTQEVSTQQVERIRLLETEVRTLKRLNELLEGR